MAGFSKAAVVGLIGIGLGVGASYMYVKNEENKGVVGSMISGFEKRNHLIVLVADVVAVVDSVDAGMIDILDARQTAIIPARVDYTIDMSKISEKSVNWNETAGLMTITAPLPMIQPANLAEERARYFRSGVLIGGDSAQKMFQDNSRRAKREAMTLAKNPKLISIAQNAAEEAIKVNAQAYLAASGHENAGIEVKFVSNRNVQ